MNDQERVSGWLRRHRVRDLELTPLVVARVAVRCRGERIKKGVMLALIAAFGVGWAVEGMVNDHWFGWSDPRPATGLVSVGGGYLLLAVVTGAVFWLQQRADLRIAHSLRERVTRSEAVSVATVLGGQNLRLLLVAYGGGIIIGAASAELATEPRDRILALTFVLGMMVCAGIVTGVVAHVVRRPAVANDESSLEADDLLRRMDAGEALFPYPVYVAAIAVVYSAGSPLFGVFLAFAVAAVVAWGLKTTPAAPAGVGPGAWT